MRPFIFVFIVALSLFSRVSADESASSNYACSACVRILSKAAHAEATFHELCLEGLAKEGCSLLFGNNLAALKQQPSSRSDFCFEHGFCATPSAAWLSSTAAASAAHAAASTNTPSIRISKAIGSTGYSAARISLVATNPITTTDFPFPGAYIAPFQYKWTQFYLATALVELTVPGPNAFTIAGRSVSVRLPEEDAAVRGLVISDPCITSEWVTCKYASQWDMFNKMTGLINAAAVHGDLDYWQILGDNFYDQAGNATNAFFDALTIEAKSTVMLSVPGNHDTWVHADPSAYTPDDQLQNGFFQFYGQDTLAASHSNYSTPFDFSVDPNKAGSNAYTLPPASNLFTYNKMGNVVFVGFSGAHDFAAQKVYFQEACTFASSSHAQVVLLEGHWNVDGDGCVDGAVPEVYRAISELPECLPVKDKIRYLMGHQHCNNVQQEGAGFMVGGAGMSGCGQFGVTILDSSPAASGAAGAAAARAAGGVAEGAGAGAASTAGAAGAGDAGAGAGVGPIPLSVYHFRINSDTGPDYYNQTVECFRANGVSGCYHLDNVDVWALAAV